MGLDEKASAKEIRKAIRRNKNEIFEVIEETVEDLLTSGWQENEFFNDFVEVKNLAMDDANEFESARPVITFSNSSYTPRPTQKVGTRNVSPIPSLCLSRSQWFPEILPTVNTVLSSDWTKLVNKIYEAMDDYVNELVYKAVISAGSQVLPGSEQFYKTAALDKAAKSTFVTMVEDVQAANRGAEVVIMGTKAALSKLYDLSDVSWIAEEDKRDRRNLGRLGIWEGTRLIEIPQVFAKNDTTKKMVNSNVLLIMPVADNKFVKLVYEGDSQIKEVTDSTEKNDMTYEFKYLTKLGVATIIGRYFGTWNIVA